MLDDFLEKGDIERIEDRTITNERLVEILYEQSKKIYALEAELYNHKRRLAEIVEAHKTLNSLQVIP